MTREELHRAFIRSVDEAPSKRFWAEEHGIPVQNVSAMYNGTIPVAGKALEALGVQRFVAETFTYGRPVEPPSGWSDIPLHANGRIARKK